MKTNNRPAALITVTGLFAAMIALMTAYIFHIPYGANGGYIHFGDALIYIAAVLLPRPYALAAAAIGGGLADLMTAPMWAPATILIKMLITLPFTSHSTKMLEMRNIIAPCPFPVRNRLLSGGRHPLRLFCSAAGFSCRKRHTVRRKRGYLSSYRSSA